MHSLSISATCMCRRGHIIFERVTSLMPLSQDSLHFHHIKANRYTQMQLSLSLSGVVTQNGSSLSPDPLSEDERSQGCWRRQELKTNSCVYRKKGRECQSDMNPSSLHTNAHVWIFFTVFN